MEALGVKIQEITAVARLRGTVVDGQLVSRVEVSSPGLGKFQRDLDAVPVPAGRVLNPLQPVNRLGRVRPGLRWVVPEVNPLRDAVLAMAKDHGVSWAVPREDLIAEVGSESQTLAYKGEGVPCWVIEYRGASPKARTWVKVADGKVLRQEAFDGGERIAMERDD